MKKIIFIAILLGLTSLSANAQTRSLKTEEDGFQWYVIFSSDWKYEGAESVDGETLIPLSRQYTFICYHSKSGHKGYFRVGKGDKDGACDIYGREIIAPQYRKLYYLSKGFSWEDSEGNDHYLGITLDANGRASSYGHTGSTSSTTRSASSATSHQNSTATASSTNDKFGLKYSGNYISDANSYDVYTGSLAASGWELNHTVEIYDDYIIVDKSKYEFVRMNGSERVYKGNSISFSGTSSQSYYYVDAIYNIREITDFSSMYGSSRYQCRWRKEGGAAPAQPQYNNGYNSGYNNTYNNSYQQPQQQQTPAYQKPAQSKDCTICHGSGKCNTCNGKGYYTGLGINSGTHLCPNCPNHSGRCQWCNGTGKQK